MYFCCCVNRFYCAYIIMRLSMSKSGIVHWNGSCNFEAMNLENPGSYSVTAWYSNRGGSGLSSDWKLVTSGKWVW